MAKTIVGNKPWNVVRGVGNVDNMPWDKEKVQREVMDEFGDRPPGAPTICPPCSRAYARGWQKIFGKKRQRGAK